MASQTERAEVKIEPTPECIGSQTVGPYYAIGLDYLVSEAAAGPEAPGTHVTLRGTLLDGDGVPVPDAILEVWQADARGAFPRSVPLPAELAATAVAGFARLSTHRDGQFMLHTVKPGPVRFPDGSLQAPHLVVLIFMRGILRHLVTRVYFPDEPANAADPVLSLVPEARRATLIAQPSANSELDSGAPGDLHWDVRLQGEGETVFFAC